MKRLLFLSLFLVATPGPAALSQEAALPTEAALSQEAALSPDGVVELDRFLGGVVDEGKVPAVEAMVVDREGVLYHGAFGRRNAAEGLELEKGGLFDMASMAKPVTSVAVMLLVEQEEVALDDPASGYVPALGQVEVMASFDPEATAYTSRPPRAPVTIRHLLTHTSGFGYPWLQEPLQRLAAKLGEPDTYDYTRLPLLHDPGEAWNYGIGTRVLGTLIENVSGQRVDEFLEARLFAPLGMHDSFYRIPAEKLDRRVTLHVREEGGLVEQPLPETQEPLVVGDASLMSTAGDYGRFLRMLLNGGTLDGTRILSEASVRAMTRNQIGELTVQEVLNGFPVEQGRDKFGFGFQIATAKPGDAPGRSAGSYTWAGAYNTFFWVDPARGIGAVLLMQTWPFHDETARAVYAGFERRVYESLR